MHRYQNCLYGATRDILMAYVYMPSIQKKRLPLISSFIYQSFHFLYQSFQSYQTAFHIYFSYFQQFSCPFFFCCQTPHLPVSFIFLKKIHYAKIMTKKEEDKPPDFHNIIGHQKTIHLPKKWSFAISCG